MPHAQPAAHKRRTAHPAKNSSASMMKMKTDAISVLSEDHQHVKELFHEFKKMRGQKNADDRKKELVKEICIALTIHTKAEEELFYPAARRVIADEEMMEEADVEHAGAKELIQQLQSMHPGDAHYDAKVIVLEEYIDHHVNEEEGKIFPLVKKAKVDIDRLGEKILQRKGELNSNMGEVTISMLSKS